MRYQFMGPFCELRETTLLDIAPPPLPTLANFVPGTQCRAVADPGKHSVGREKERFFYLWGNEGCGKSHLLQGLAGAYEHHRVKCDYLACAEDTRFEIEGETECVLVDDVDRLGPEAQMGLFNLYNRIRDEAHAFLLVTGPVAPAELQAEG